jgi:hypothetical protein
MAAAPRQRYGVHSAPSPCRTARRCPSPSPAQPAAAEPTTSGTQQGQSVATDDDGLAAAACSVGCGELLPGRPSKRKRASSVAATAAATAKHSRVDGSQQAAGVADGAPRRQLIVAGGPGAAGCGGALVAQQAAAAAARQQLDTEGYIVVPFAGADRLRTLQGMFDSAISSFPEFVPGSPDSRRDYVLGGFAALGNAASFHNMPVRRIREWCLSHLFQHVFCTFAGTGQQQQQQQQQRIEVIADRMMLRRRGRAPSAESWHRDVAPKALSGDVVLGGWLNLDSAPQSFSCIPGTHRDRLCGGADGGGRQQQGSAPGFVGVSREAAAAQGLRERAVRVCVPAGAILLFHEHILHEVRSQRAAHDMRRLFLAWRITHSALPYFPNIDRFLDEQAVMPLKSMQAPPMYATLHWTNWRAKIEAFSVGVRPDCQETRVVGSGQHRGRRHHIVARHMPSLSQLSRSRSLGDGGGGGCMYPRYGPAERALYRPQPMSSIEPLLPFSDVRRAPLVVQAPQGSPP